MSEFSNRLKPEELERLALLAEECGEVIQIVNKIIRHGYESQNPLIASHETNRDLLGKELSHVQIAISIMKDAGDIDQVGMAHYRNKKRCTINKWLHHNEV